MVLRSPRDIEAVDFNGDGDLDVVFTSFDNDAIWVFTGNGAGGLGSEEGGTRGSVGRTLPDGPRSVAIGDLDEDGRPDILVGLQLNGQTAILYNATAFVGRP